MAERNLRVKVDEKTQGNDVPCIKPYSVMAFLHLSSAEVLKCSKDEIL